MLAAFEKHGVDATRRRLSRNFFFGDFDGTLLDEVVAHAGRTPDHVFVREIEGMCDWNGAETARRCRLPVLHVAAPSRRPSFLLTWAFRGRRTTVTIKLAPKFPSWRSA